MSCSSNVTTVYIAVRAVADCSSIDIDSMGEGDCNREDEGACVSGGGWGGGLKGGLVIIDWQIPLGG